MYTNIVQGSASASFYFTQGLAGEPGFNGRDGQKGERVGTWCFLPVYKNGDIEGLQSLYSQKWRKSSFDIKSPNFILQDSKKQTIVSESAAKEVSFEWSHRRISFTG